MRNRTPDETPIPMPILSAAFRPDEVVGPTADGDDRGEVVVCAVTDPLETGAVADAEEGEDRDEVAICAVNDALEATAVAGTKADEKSVVGALVASISDGEEVTGEVEATALASGGSFDWRELSVAPGVEHPTPPPLPLTASCL